MEKKWLDVVAVIKLYKRDVYFECLHPQRDTLPPAISVHTALSVSSFLFLVLEVDVRYGESTTLKWRTFSPFPKVEMRNRLRIPIAIDQMNGRDFERLISPSQSVWSWRLLQRPRERTMTSEILPAIPLAAGETAHTYYIQFCLQHFIIFL